MICKVSYALSEFWVQDPTLRAEAAVYIGLLPVRERVMRRTVKILQCFPVFMLSIFPSSLSHSQHLLFLHPPGFSLSFALAIFVCVLGVGVHPCMHVAVRGHLAGISSPHPVDSRSQNPGHQVLSAHTQHTPDPHWPCLGT